MRNGRHCAVRLISSRKTRFDSCEPSTAFWALAASVFVSASFASFCASSVNCFARVLSFAAIAFSASSILSMADLSSSGANSLLPPLLALVTAALDTASCSVGAGVVAQPTMRTVVMTMAGVTSQVIIPFDPELKGVCMIIPFRYGVKRFTGGSHLRACGHNVGRPAIEIVDCAVGGSRVAGAHSVHGREVSQRTIGQTQ